MPPLEAISGSDAWTARRVGDCLVAEFRRRPYAPVYAPPADLALAGAANRFDPIRLTSLSLDCAAERRAVLEWARAKAAGNLRELARQRGRDRGAERRRMAATLARVAAAFNAAGVPVPDAPRGATSPAERDEKGSGDAGRYSRSFGLSASVASPPCGEGKAYCVTAAIARNSKDPPRSYHG